MNRIIIAIIVGLSFFATGCNTPTQTLAAQIAVTLATEQVVKDHPGYAAKAVAIANDVIALADNDEAVVDAVIDLVRSKIDWQKLADESPTSVSAVNLLLAAIEVELEKRVSVGSIPEDYRVKIKTVAEWVKLAAEPYVTKE
jgi:hypothetical protein